eukprot:CAMPEP_0168603160 /NCGR_PEP_ID=MMETSP0420-20121227/14568_1 /TAXON_ID=498008 /ORGANISM="Pessonella sp." /LENGTH=165 /DNA_ID=CAMNT_0008642097 /DNA_START=83 /DNA_END=580 /DNA_ORIENTATION=+
MANGTKTNKTTDKMMVVHGISTLASDNSSLTVGAYTNSNITSLTSTCTSVYAGSPCVSEDHTKTIAVHGLPPKMTEPATYCASSSASRIAPNANEKNNSAKPYMKNGCTHQFISVVSTMPLGCLRTSKMALGATCNIIGAMIIHSRMAVGMLTCATVVFSNVAAI